MQRFDNWWGGLSAGKQKLAVTAAAWVIGANTTEVVSLKQISKNLKSTVDDKEQSAEELRKLGLNAFVLLEFAQLGLRGGVKTVGADGGSASGSTVLTKRGWPCPEAGAPAVENVCFKNLLSFFRCSKLRDAEQYRSGHLQSNQRRGAAANAGQPAAAAAGTSRAQAQIMFPPFHLAAARHVLTTLTNQSAASALVDFQTVFKDGVRARAQDSAPPPGARSSGRDRRPGREAADEESQGPR